MPIDHDIVDGLAAGVRDIYAEAELAVLRLITDRLRRGLDASDWAQRKHGEILTLYRDAARVANRLTRDVEGAVRPAVAEAYGHGNTTAYGDVAAATDGIERDIALRSILRNPDREVFALADALLGELRPVHAQILPQVDDVYRRAIAGATARALTGVQTQRGAAQSAWNTLVDRGVTSYEDRSGRSWRLHTYVEMATRTALARAATQALVDGYLAGGQEFVWVPDRAGECPACRPWEHAILSLTGVVVPPAVATLDQARAAGLMHPNCKHVVRLYRPGVTRIPKGPTADPAGEAARTRQRYIERQMRHWRERAAAAFDERAKAAALFRVRGWSAEMERHLDATGLPRLLYRERPGAGHTTPPHRRRDRASVPSV